MSEETRIILVNNLTPNDYIKVSNNFHRLEKEIIRLNNIIKEVRQCINDFAIEEEDYSKIYNQEEQELLSILDKVEENK